MKRPLLAFTLSFFLPGAGLLYLGKWKWALINFGIVLLIGGIVAIFLPEELIIKYGHYVAIACGGGSGGLAHALTRQINLKNPAKEP